MKHPAVASIALICAALAAQFSLGPAFAAVPVEESVEEPAQTRLVERTESLPTPTATRAPRRAAELAIPPTIEPAVQPREEVSPGRSQPRMPGGDDPALTPGGEAQLGGLFYQLQLLRQEVQDLRGQLEEQDYLIRRLQRDQQEQYLDLDKRVVALFENRPAPAPTTATEPNAPLIDTGAPLSERDAYTAAFEAMRGRQFEASMAGFQQLIEQYPNGQYTPNAYYWIGELHLAAASSPEQARQSFMQVVNLYPDHQKAPDALYKLGLVYQQLGDPESARRYLEQARRAYPDRSTASLAEKLLAEIQ